MSDLITPGGKRPKFAQVYSLRPDDALELRLDNFSDELDPIKHQIIATLHDIMNEYNPYAQTFVTAGEVLREAEERNAGKIPQFQVIF